MLENVKPPKDSKMPFKLGKNRNSECAEILGRLGALSIYGREDDFHYGYPVTKGEACDVIVRACIALLGA